MSLSPMMQQYLKTKENYQDCLLFYRLGDFYEMFYDDALTASRELDLTLTGRDCGLGEKAPMCGVPYHAVESYIAKLVQKGFKVGICEQMSDPKTTKGIVQRDVIRVITPGTLIDESMLKEDKNNYLMCLCWQNNTVGAAWVDISTADFNFCFIDTAVKMRLNDLLSRVEPAEIICNREMCVESLGLSLVKFGQICPFTDYSDDNFQYDEALKNITKQLNPKSLEMIQDKPLCIMAGGALMHYIETTQKRALSHLRNASYEKESKYMVLDASARKTLELVESADGRKQNSLYWLMDKTSTAMGSRLLRKWIEQPDISSELINAKLDSVEEIKSNVIVCDELHNLLKDVHDIERLAGRLAYGNFSPKDCVSLMQSLALLPDIINTASNFKTLHIKNIYSAINPLHDVTSLLKSAIDERPPAHIRDGGVIRDGFDAELDEIRQLNKNAKNIMAQLEAKERELTGIRSLKIGFNNVFGYFIEVSKNQLDLVPYRYTRKQTVASGERYITEELKILEDKILHSQERAQEKEVLLYEQIKSKLSEFMQDYLLDAGCIAHIDCLLSHAIISKDYNFTKPSIGENTNHIKIIDGRHCVVEKLLTGENFVPNDTFLDCDENKIMLITGPNMAGKSIYMKQVALITVMAHMGCFVPASLAEISLTDKIFTRVGASDDLATGRSTFMVEMSEVSDIMKNATDKSLLLLDEIGRGTSTYDGLSIAWSIIEYLTAHLNAKALFSTHYHELTELEGTIHGLKNYKMTIKEFKNNIVFLRKLLRGSANRSFGIEVAALAGLPPEIVLRAKELLKKLESTELTRKSEMAGTHQISIFGTSKLSEIENILKDLDIDNISPRNALDILTDLKEKSEAQ